MIKADFSQIKLKDIEGNVVTADFQKQIGNQLYMQGHDIEECELGKKIYFAEGEIELTDKEADMVRRITQGYSFVARQGIDEMLKG